MWRSSVFVCIHLKNRPVPTRLSISLHLPVCLSLLLPLQPRPVLSVHLSFASSRLHPPPSLFSPTIHSSSHRLSVIFSLTYFLLSLSSLLCVSATRLHANTSLFIYTHSLTTCLLTHFFHTHTHTLSHCSLTVILPSVSSSYKSIVLSYIIRSALRQ